MGVADFQVPLGKWVTSDGLGNEAVEAVIAMSDLVEFVFGALVEGVDDGGGA